MSAGTHPNRSDPNRSDPNRSAAADAAAAPLDLLLTDAATSMLGRVNPGASGLRLAAALAVRPGPVAGRGTLLNPAAVKAAIDTGGQSALAGLRHFAADMTVPPRVPSMVEPDAYQVGVDLAATSSSSAGPTHWSGPAARPCSAHRWTWPRSTGTPTWSPGITDHICPWPSCYQSTQLLSGRQRFVLSTSGLAPIFDAPGTYVYDH